MIDKRKGPARGKDINSEEIFFDEKTDLKIHQHLADKNDEISDQDIKNARTDFNVENTQEAEPGILKEPRQRENDTGDNKESKETNDTNEEPPIITPWNILDA